MPQIETYEENCLAAIHIEYHRSVGKHGDFNSAHEGYAVLLEEVEELWNEIKAQKHDPTKMKVEAVQIGAMALKFLVFLQSREPK